MGAGAAVSIERNATARLAGLGSAGGNHLSGLWGIGAAPVPPDWAWSD